MKEPTSSTNHTSDALPDLANLTCDSRKCLHAILYRQECRIWLLAGGLALGAFLLTSEPTSFADSFARYWAIAISVFLAFWVCYPTQRILAQLRKSSSREDIASVERAFDGSWRSVWDFVPPLILPLLPSLALLGYRIWQVL